MLGRTKQGKDQQIIEQLDRLEDTLQTLIESIRDLTATIDKSEPKDEDEFFEPKPL